MNASNDRPNETQAGGGDATQHPGPATDAAPAAQQVVNIDTHSADQPGPTLDTDPPPPPVVRQAVTQRWSDRERQVGALVTVGAVMLLIGLLGGLAFYSFILAPNATTFADTQRGSGAPQAAPATASDSAKTTEQAAAPAAEPNASTATAPNRIEVAPLRLEVSPVRIEVAQSYAPSPPLPTTDREPAVVRVEPAYQYQYPSGARPVRTVPYPGAPYVPPVRPYDPNESRFQYTHRFMEGPQGELIPVTDERALTALEPVILRRPPTDQPSAPAAPAPATPTSPPPTPPTPVPDSEIRAAQTRET